MNLSKITSRQILKKECQKWRQEKKIIGFTSGSFDLLHQGHTTYLQKAKKHCDILIVGLNSDTSIQNYKETKRPIITENQRIIVLSALSSVDKVFLFHETNNKDNLLSLKPNLYIKAGDYSLNSMTSAKYLKDWGGKAITVPFEKGISTTNIIETILKKYAKEFPICENLKDKKVKPAIFLDRDGVINKEIEYLHLKEEFQLLPGVTEGLFSLMKMGFKLIIITNQAGIGMGYFTKEDFYKVNKEMLKQLSKKEILIDRIYYCPHSKAEGCDCRKPKIGLIKRAEKEALINLEKSFFIGDQQTDLLAGKKASLKTILIEGNPSSKNLKTKPNYTAKNLIQAANWIQKEPF